MSRLPRLRTGADAGRRALLTAATRERARRQVTSTRSRRSGGWASRSTKPKSPPIARKTLRTVRRKARHGRTAVLRHAFGRNRTSPEVESTETRSGEHGPVAEGRRVTVGTAPSRDLNWRAPGSPDFDCARRRIKSAGARCHKAGKQPRRRGRDSRSRGQCTRANFAGSGLLETVERESSRSACRPSTAANTACLGAEPQHVGRLEDRLLRSDPHGEAVEVRLRRAGAACATDGGRRNHSTSATTIGLRSVRTRAGIHRRDARRGRA